jgi:hypothetical protein
MSAQGRQGRSQRRAPWRSCSADTSGWPPRDAARRPLREVPCAAPRAGRPEQSRVGHPHVPWVRWSGVPVVWPGGDGLRRRLKQGTGGRGGRHAVMLMRSRCVVESAPDGAEIDNQVGPVGVGHARRTLCRDNRGVSASFERVALQRLPNWVHDPVVRHVERRVPLRLEVAIAGARRCASA